VVDLLSEAQARLVSIEVLRRFTVTGRYWADVPRVSFGAFALTHGVARREYDRGVAGKLRAHAWPWFLLAAVVLIVGYVVHGGMLQSVVRSAAGFLFLAACIRLVGLMVRGNPTSAEMVTRRSIEAGVTGWMAEDAGVRSKRRAAERRRRGQTPPLPTPDLPRADLKPSPGPGPADRGASGAI
jgi:hypothetical protein